MAAYKLIAAFDPQRTISRPVSRACAVVIVAVFLFASVTVCDANTITVDRFVEPLQFVTAPPGGSTSVLMDGLAAVGGTRLVSVETNSPGSPFSLAAAVGSGLARFEPFFFSNALMLMEWDANGDGLGLDLTELEGLSFGRGDSDGSLEITIRLLTSEESLFLLETNTSAYDAIGDVFDHSHVYHEGIYTFDRFTSIGTPDWAQINAIEFELRGGGTAGYVGNIQFVTLPQSVPEGGPGALSYFGLGLVALAVGHVRRLKAAR